MGIVYLGKKYTEQEILLELKNNNFIKYYRSSNVEAETARFIAEGNIIGWFQGRCEIGPRALGNRSILADARNVEMKKIVNNRVKFREEFRPFAPSVLWEYQEEYFDLKVKSPYMLIVRNVNEDKRTVIPSVTHVDNSGRIQTVCSEENPRYYKLVTEFMKITNVPVILNTSFNIKGQPIVETPKDALDCFLNTSLDKLIIGDYVIFKEIRTWKKR